MTWEVYVVRYHFFLFFSKKILKKISKKNSYKKFQKIIYNRGMSGVGVFLSGWVGYGWTRGMRGWVD
jgi:hypothetical protein